MNLGDKGAARHVTGREVIGMAYAEGRGWRPHEETGDSDSEWMREVRKARMPKLRRCRVRGRGGWRQAATPEAVRAMDGKGKGEVRTSGDACVEK